MRRADLSVVTADELGPGETFGEACMLEEHRTLAERRRGILDRNDDDDITSSKNNNTDETALRERAEEQLKPEGGRPRDSSGRPRGATAPGRETEKYERRPEAPEKSGEHSAGSGEAGLTDGVDASGGGGPNPNPNVGRSMETCQTLEPTRLVLILKADFHRIPGLLKHCSHAFKVMLGKERDALGVVTLKLSSPQETLDSDRITECHAEMTQ